MVVTKRAAALARRMALTDGNRSPGCAK